MQEKTDIMDSAKLVEISSLLTEQLINGQKLECIKVIDNLIKQNVDLSKVYEMILKDSLYQVGTLWENNKISVAKEHLATAITESLMNHFYDSLDYKEKSNLVAISTTIENEQHQVGARMITDFLEQEGWNCYFLGSETPINDLLKLIEEYKPNLLAISVSIFMNFNILLNTLDTVTRHYPELKIIVGGQAFLHGGQDIADKYANVTYLKGFADLKPYIDNFKI